ncbi:hypothetical protein NMY22_g2590 [Coprinellus aureogranulatus]|nr:hypothetical protein NMY22_g2590 [Coprinellus aureogranulatus]
MLGHGLAYREWNMISPPPEATSIVEPSAWFNRRPSNICALRTIGIGPVYLSFQLSGASISGRAPGPNGTLGSINRNGRSINGLGQDSLQGLQCTGRGTLFLTCVSDNEGDNPKDRSLLSIVLQDMHENLQGVGSVAMATEETRKTSLDEKSSGKEEIAAQQPLYERPTGLKGLYTHPRTQIALLGFVCFMCPGLFNALTGLGGGGQFDTTASANANSALYATFAFFSFFAG